MHYRPGLLLRSGREHKPVKKLTNFDPQPRVRGFNTYQGPGVCPSSTPIAPDGH